MPLSATPEDIKAYQKQLEKNKIKPDNLPPCLRCHVESTFFKEHAYRGRKFLVIVDMLVKTVLSALIRFRCPGCGKTFTYYPDFALPHKQLRPYRCSACFTFLIRVYRARMIQFT